MWRITGIALALFPAGLAAQQPLTLDAAIASARAHNASIRAAQAGADEAAAGRGQTRSAWFPTVLFTESWQRGNQPVFVFSSLLSARRFAAANFAIDALNHPDPVGFFQTTVGLEQSVFDGQRRAAAVVASARADAADAASSETIAAVMLATTEAFARLVSAQAARRAAAAALDAAREDHARAARRRDAGMLTDADVLALAVHVANLEQRTIASSGAAASAAADLNRLMGVPIESPVVAAEPAAGIDPGVGGGDIAVLLAEAEKSRPELARAAAAERGAAAARRQARSALLPSVVAQAAVNVSGTRVSDRASSWIAGGELRWTFSTGGGALAALRASTAGLVRARAEMDDARGVVHVDVVKAYHQLETAQAQRAASAAAVEQARESQRIIRDRFDAGLAPVNDVLRASTALLDADASRIAALVDGIVAAAALRRSLGRNP